MKLSISSLPLLDSRFRKSYLSIKLSLEQKGLDFTWWAPSCFPNRVYSQLNGKKENLYCIFYTEKEIGRYYPSEQVLELDRGLLLHYLFSGCRISSVLKRILLFWIRENILSLSTLDRLRLDSVLF